VAPARGLLLCRELDRVDGRWGGQHGRMDSPASQEPGQPDAAADRRVGRDLDVDPDLSSAVSYSLAQTVEARLRGIRNYTRLVREAQRRS
jgi:hypothetical protein